MEDSKVEQRHRTRPRAYLLPGVRGVRCPLLCRAGAGGIARGKNQDVVGVQRSAGCHRVRLPRSGARCVVASRRHSRRQDRQLPSVSAHTLECESPRHLWDTGALRGCRAEHADLRGERPGQIQGHRHHARSAEFRPLLAVRSTHVPRQWKGARNSSLANVWHARLRFLNVDTKCVVMRTRGRLLRGRSLSLQVQPPAFICL